MTITRITACGEEFYLGSGQCDSAYVLHDYGGSYRSYPGSGFGAGAQHSIWSKIDLSNINTGYGNGAWCSTGMMDTGNGRCYARQDIFPLG